MRNVLRYALNTQYHRAQSDVGNREEKITTEYEKLLSLIYFVDEFPKAKRRMYPQYTSE